LDNNEDNKKIKSQFGTGIIFFDGVFVFPKWLQCNGV